MHAGSDVHQEPTETIGIEIVKTMPMSDENVGAILHAKNANANGWTKHMDIPYHFIRELLKEVIITIMFVRSVDNTVDIFAKYMSRAVFHKHSKRFICDAMQQNLEIMEELMEEKKWLSAVCNMRRVSTYRQVYS